MAIYITANTFIPAGSTIVIANPPIDNYNFHLDADRPGYIFNGMGVPPPYFRNAGSITITHSHDPSLSPRSALVGFAIARSSGTGPESVFHNQATGIFRVVSTWELGPAAETIGYDAPQQAINFLNDGLFQVSSLGNAVGLQAWDSRIRVTNNGTLEVDGQYHSQGVSLANGGIFRNSGLIDIFGGLGAVGVYLGQNVSGYVNGEPTFVNHGTIRAISADEPSYGVYVAISLEGGVYLNSGIIEADNAFWINPGDGPASTIRSPETLINHGEIRGDVMLAYGNDVLENHGAMSGFTDLGEGNDVYEGASGSHDGLVAAGTGDDRLTGGEGDEVFLGQEGRDAINAGAGDDVVDGGSGSDALDGGSGNDILSYVGAAGGVTVDLAAGSAMTGADQDRIRNFEIVVGSHYNDRITGSTQAELLEGSGGDDTLSGGGGADDLLGDIGNDLLSGGTGDDYFHFSLGDGHDVITDFRPGTAEDALLIYGYSSYAELRQVGADTLVVLSPGDSILLRNVTAASLQPSDILFSQEPLPATPIPQLPFAQVVDHDFIIGEGETYPFIEPLPVVLADQLFEHTGLVLETVPGLTAPQIFVAGSLRVESAATDGDVVGITFAIADGPPAGVSHISILETGSAEVSATGGANAVGIVAPGFVWNAGNVSVTSSSGDALGFSAGWFDGRHVNSGTIEVVAGNEATGAYLQNTNDFWNSGDILVTGAVASVGVWYEGLIHPASPELAEFVNSGTIKVTDGTAALDSIALAFDRALKPATIWNLGLLEADYAILRLQLYSPATDLPHVVYNLGDIKGIVDLGVGDQSVFNQGTMVGRIDLGSGADLYDGRGGLQSGGVFGGVGFDTLIGGIGAELLDGGAGDDLVSGGAGVDTMTGGSGNDTFHFEAGFGADVITDFTAGGTSDAIRVSGYSSYQALQQQGADTRVVFSATDSILLRGVVATTLTAADFLFGAALLTGSVAIPEPPLPPPPPDFPALLAEAPEFIDAVADIPLTLNGAGAADDLRGRGRDDQLSGGAGPDQLMGYAGADRLHGDSGDDRLFGGIGHDVLDGGIGTDFMAGGSGDDVYFVDGPFDRVVEYDGEGLDEVRTTVTSHILAPNVELLSGLSAAGQTLTGNDLENLIIGNAGNDVLQGGAASDVLVGGLGNDTYVVDDGDTVVEGAGAGNDSVRSAFSYVLGANLEQLTLTGAAAINGTGNGLANAITGNGAANILDGGLGADAMTGGAGNDVYIVDNVGDAITEVAGGGTDSVQSSINHVLGANVENLTLTGGALNGTGNGLNNIIAGNGANNRIDGGGGADAMAGGFGHDTYIVDNLGDTTTEALNAGNDSVQSSVTHTLAANIEYLTLTGASAINGTGNAFNNILNGNAASNILDGGLGADFLTGGAGDDTYVVDNASDKVTEAAGGGTDTVQSNVAWTLGAEVERLILTGTAAVSGIGNGLANQITGNAAANLIDGGLGADTMAGGLGNDTFIVDDAGDVVNEAPGGGTDLIRSSVSFSLMDSINAENLTLTGSDAVDGTGNVMANIIIGNGTSNILDGGNGNDTLDGGAGADTLIGGAGHDTYFVDDFGDIVSDTGGGNDHVHSGISFVLGADFEYLTLTGNAPLSGTGNAKNNLIYGNAGNNVIDGGLGVDFMVGGMGDDVYYVDSGSDSITEHLNQGTDTVMSSVNHALRGNIENLTLIGTNQVIATGNTLDNVLTGNGANNILYGGLGADRMSDGGGNDVFQYRAAAESTAASRDTITGFGAGDKINLSAIDAIAGTPANNDAFTFIGANTFGGVAGELRATETGGVWTIEADVNGDGLADLVIGLTTAGGHIVGAGDFLL